MIMPVAVLAGADTPVGPVWVDVMSTVRRLLSWGAAASVTGMRRMLLSR